MENASKALIMAASVLLGVMILSVAVYLFYMYGEYSSSAYAQLEAKQIDQFNTQFLKYYGSRNETEPVLCTAHDIISLANLAQQNNIEKEIDDLTKYDTNTYYIQIDVVINGVATKETRNLEKWSNEEQLEFIQKYSIYTDKVKDEDGNYKLDDDGNPIKELQTKYYICEEYIISEVTKRVCYMKFKEYFP